MTKEFTNSDTADLKVILSIACQGKPLTPEQHAILRQNFLKNPILFNPSLLNEGREDQTFSLTPDLIDQALQQQLELLRSIYPHLNTFCCTYLGWQACPLDLLWCLWLPLALQLVHWRRSLDRPLVQGILGGQGTGKTTLTLILSQILPQLGFQVCRLSIDDLYKTYAERQQLQQFDPRFRWRGPPGTHDVELGLTTLQQLRQAQFPVAIPRFDKSTWGGAGDRTDPELVHQADIVLFEGWFVGVRPVDPLVFETAPSPIKTEADRAFAREINLRLQDYLPLWNLFDRLIVLYPGDYQLSQQWRQQAEQEMIASGKSGMSDTEIHEFVEYFWKALHPDLFIQPLIQSQNAHAADLAIEIDSHHQPVRIYHPARSLNPT